MTATSVIRYAVSIATTKMCRNDEEDLQSPLGAGGKRNHHSPEAVSSDNDIHTRTPWYPCNT
jgi:hypothetical protein